MSRSYHDIAFTPGVRGAQVHYGSRAAQDRLHRSPEGSSTAHDPMGPDERAFVGERDGFYLATVSETGWPYVQFRGGPPGFVTAPDEHTLAWPDFRGNRQYVTTGNVAHDPRVAIIFMDHPRRQRLKVYGTVRLVDVPRGEGSDLMNALPDYPARVEREVRVDVHAHDWNCPQHITPRWSAEEIAPVLDRLRGRIDELEAENAGLRRTPGPTRRTGA